MPVQIGNSQNIQTNLIKPLNTGTIGGSGNSGTIDMTSDNPAVKNAGVQEGIGDTLELSTKKEDAVKEKELLKEGGNVKDQMKNQEGNKSWADKLQNLIKGNQSSSTQSAQLKASVTAQAQVASTNLNNFMMQSLDVVAENETLTEQDTQLEAQDSELEAKEQELVDKQKELEGKISNGENVEENTAQLESIGGELESIGSQRTEIQGTREAFGGQLLANNEILGGLDMQQVQEQKGINMFIDKTVAQSKAQQAAAQKAQQTAQIGQQVGQTMSTIGQLGVTVGTPMTAFLPTTVPGGIITAAGTGLNIAGQGVSGFSQEGGMTAGNALNLATNTFGAATGLKGQFKTPPPPQNTQV